MIAIIGATGNTGKTAAETLLAAGEKVRVIGRTAEKLQSLVAKGAEPFVGNVIDADAMTKALHGADSAYIMIPPDVKQKDLRAYDTVVIESLYTAIDNSGLRHAVVLSSIGAEMAEGNGPIAGLHEMEESFKRMHDVNFLFLRPAYFMENHLAAIAVYKSMGIFAGLIKDSVKFPMIATRDIGQRAAAELRAKNFSGHQVKELHGQRDLNMNECATIFGTAVGKPGLGYMHAPAMMAKPAMIQSGMSADTVDKLIEMCKAISEGRIKMLEPRNADNTTPTSFETFTEEVLVPAYKGKSASA
jgi:uncharacterized protein YbjT (DUF2867 family)